MRDSDATLVFCCGSPTGGTALTIELAGELGKPCLVIDLGVLADEQASAAIVDWLGKTEPQVLNVAGSRWSEAPGIADSTRRILRIVFAG